MKTLLDASTPEQPIEAQLFEAEDKVGGTFRYRSYDNADLVSSKQLTAFSDFRFSAETPDHISLPHYVQYLEDYCTNFGLWDKINLGCRVAEITPLHSTEKGSVKRRHQVTYEERSKPGETRIFECTHVAMCTGLHVEPNLPVIPGIGNVQGDVFHSSEYKGRSQLAGKDVLILGCGETAMGAYKDLFSLYSSSMIF